MTWCAPLFEYRHTSWQCLLTDLCEPRRTCTTRLWPQFLAHSCKINSFFGAHIFRLLAGSLTTQIIKRYQQCYLQRPNRGTSVATLRLSGKKRSACVLISSFWCKGLLMMRSGSTWQNWTWYLEAMQPVWCQLALFLTVRYTVLTSVIAGQRTRRWWGDLPGRPAGRL
jgi:hypothetical protein